MVYFSCLIPKCDLSDTNYPYAGSVLKLISSTACIKSVIGPRKLVKYMSQIGRNTKKMKIQDNYVHVLCYYVGNVMTLLRRVRMYVRLFSVFFYNNCVVFFTWPSRKSLLALVKCPIYYVTRGLYVFCFWNRSINLCMHGVIVRFPCLFWWLDLTFFRKKFIDQYGF